MPFNIKIRKIQGGAVHDLKGLRCVSYFQGFENLAKETDLAVRKGMCFVGFGPGLSFDKIPSAYVFFDWISHSHLFNDLDIPSTFMYTYITLYF